MGRQTGDVGLAEPDGALVGLQAAVDEVQQAALPGTVRADQPPHLSVVQLQRHVINRDEATEALRDPVDGEDAHVPRSRFRNPKIPAGITRMRQRG